MNNIQPSKYINIRVGRLAQRFYVSLTFHLQYLKKHSRHNLIFKTHENIRKSQSSEVKKGTIKINKVLRTSIKKYLQLSKTINYA